MNIRFMLCAIAIIWLPSGATWAGDDYQAVKIKIESINSGMTVTQISESPVEGILQVQVNNKEYIYSTTDASYIFPGKLIQVTDDGFVDLTEAQISHTRKSILDSIDLSSTITFPASSGAESHEIYVFTDFSCTYCKRFHTHIEEMNQAGITVHYLAFPRGGLHTPASNLMREAWCSTDQQSALTEGKSNDEVKQDQLPCTSPISQHYAIAHKLGVTGTPAIYATDGRHLGGYLTTEQLTEALN